MRQKSLSQGASISSCTLLRIRTDEDFRHALAQAIRSPGHSRPQLLLDRVENAAALSSSLPIAMAAPAAASSKGVQAGASDMQHGGKGKPIESARQGSLTGAADKWYADGAAKGPSVPGGQGNQGIMEAEFDRDLRSLAASNTARVTIMDHLARFFQNAAATFPPRRSKVGVTCSRSRCSWCSPTSSASSPMVSKPTSA